MTLTVTRVTYARVLLDLAGPAQVVNAYLARVCAPALARCVRHQARRKAGARPARRTPAHPDVTDVQRRALFASTLQRSDAPGADIVAEAVTATVRRLGAEGCTSRMAQEFGDHPEAAAARMCWVRSVLS